MVTGVIGWVLYLNKYQDRIVWIIISPKDNTNVHGLDEYNELLLVFYVQKLTSEEHHIGALFLFMAMLF